VAQTHHASDDLEPDHEILSEVIMAINVPDRGSVGCAYYSARDQTLFFMEDAQLGGAELADSRA
jgi:DNA mismatch repair protein MSH5